MRKRRLKHLIEASVSLERVTGGDHFREIQQLVAEYQMSYGNDKWISDAVCNYLEVRRTTRQ